jgi:phosphoserine aminotransferase
LAEKGPLSSGKQAEESEIKSKLIYDVLDKYPDKYSPNPSQDVRSRMNICFRIKDDETEKAFLKGAEARNLLGLKGHRSVGGMIHMF